MAQSAAKYRSSDLSHSSTTFTCCSLPAFLSFLCPFLYSQFETRATTTMAPSYLTFSTEFANSHHEALLARSNPTPLQTRSLSVNSTQKVTLGIIVAYVVIIALLWNIPYVRGILYPFKMLVIAFHEFSHAITSLLTGGKVESISLDPREGGVTKMRGGISAITLPAGYLGSSLIGALLIFCGFDIVASKVASFVLAACFLLTLWWGKKDWLTISTILAAVGLLVACWFIAHAEALRFVVLFIGVMSALYSVWDIVSAHNICYSPQIAPDYKLY